MRDDEVVVARGGARDLNGVLLELDEDAVGMAGDSVAGEEEVIGAEGAVPVREA